MDYSIDSMIVIITSYLLGMTVTSLINKSKYKALFSMLDTYESVMADMMARIDVIDVRLSQLINTRAWISQADHGSMIGKMTGSIVDNRDIVDGNDNNNNDTTVTSSNYSCLPILNVNSSQSKAKIGNGKGNNDIIKEIMRLLADGPKTSRDIERAIGKSREHTARLMKRLYDMGYVKRDESIRPYKYTLA